MNSTNPEKFSLSIIAGMLGFLTATKVYELIKSQKKSIEPEQEEKDKKKIEYLPIAPDTTKMAMSVQKRHNVYKIVLTGGPCAGKTTSIALIADRLRERGFKVLCVPEAATLVFGGGVTIDVTKMTPNENIKFHKTLANYIMNQEDRFIEFANLSDTPTVIICDRGVLDIQAYMEPEGWQALLDESGWNAVQLRDKRYDGIIHLVTAADGAVEYYNLANKARYESSPEVAVAVDKRLRASWYGHPQYYLIDNYNKTFQEKIQKAFEAVLRLVGVESSAPKYFDKYLIKKENNDDIFPALPEGLQVEVFTIEDTFLAPQKEKNVESKIRKRGQQGVYFYQLYTTSYPRDVDTGENDWKNDGVEVKKQITGRDYLDLYEMRDPTRITLKKVRRCFFWNGQFMFIDTFLNVKGGFSLLFVTKGEKIEDLKLPTTFQIEREVSNEKEYSSYELAKICNQNKSSSK
jgi:Signal recognition particle GTPase